MNATELLISIPTTDLPDGWVDGMDVSDVGTIRSAPSAGFDSVYSDLILALVTGVSSGIIANWLYSKLNGISNKTIRVNGKEVRIDETEELQSEIDKAMSQKAVNNRVNRSGESSE